MFHSKFNWFSQLKECPRFAVNVSVYIPTPSLRLCRSSVRGAVAPSDSMDSAASLSWASSHRTPAATRWMFSIGEYNSCTQTHHGHKPSLRSNHLNQMTLFGTRGKLYIYVHLANWKQGSPVRKVEWCWVLWLLFCCERLWPEYEELLCSPPQSLPCELPPENMDVNW